MRSLFQRPCIAVVLTALAAVGHAQREHAIPEPLDQVVASEWMPVPVFVVSEVPIDQRSWKRNAGWAPRELSIEHEVVDGVLEVRLSDGDGYSGAPLSLRLARAGEGRVSVVAKRQCVQLRF